MCTAVDCIYNIAGCRAVGSGIAAKTWPPFGAVRGRQIVPLLAMGRTANLSGPGPVVVGRGAYICLARSVSSPARAYDQAADIHEAFLSLGCALICWQSLRKGVHGEMNAAPFSLGGF